MKAGIADRAAELYFELGDFDMAAMLFGKAGRHFDAAKAAAEANSEAQMIEHLQRVAPDDPHYLTAVREIARSFERRGWASLAQEKLRTVLEGQGVWSGQSGALGSAGARGRSPGESRRGRRHPT